MFFSVIKTFVFLLNILRVNALEPPIAILNIPELKFIIYGHYNERLVSQESALMKYLRIGPYEMETVSKNNSLRNVSLYLNVEEIFNNLLFPEQFTVRGYDTMVDRKDLLLLYLNTFKHQYKKSKMALVVADDNFSNGEYIREVKRICFLAELSLTEIISLSTYYRTVCENDFTEGSILNLHQKTSQLDSAEIDFITDYAYENEIVHYIEMLTGHKYTIYRDNALLAEKNIDGNELIRKINEHLYNNLRGTIKVDIKVLDLDGKTTDMIYDFTIDLDYFIEHLRGKYKFEKSCEKLFCISNYARIFKNIFGIKFSPMHKSTVLLNKVEEADRIIIPEIVRYVQTSQFDTEIAMMKYFKQATGYEETKNALELTFNEKTDLYNRIIAAEKEKRDFELAMAMKKSILKDYEDKEYLQEVMEEYEKLKKDYKTSDEIKKAVENFISNYNKVKVDKEFEKEEALKQKSEEEKDTKSTTTEDKDVKASVTEDKDTKSAATKDKDVKASVNDYTEKLKDFTKKLEEMRQKASNGETSNEDFNKLLEQLQNTNNDL